MHKNSNCKQCYEFGSCYVSFNIIFISLSAHPPPYNITAAWWRLQSLHRLADIPLSDIWYYNLPAMACNHTATNLDLWFLKPLQLCFIPHYSSRWHSLQEAFIQLIKDHSLPPQAHTTCLFSCTHLSTQSPALLSFEFTATVTLYVSVCPGCVQICPERGHSGITSSSPEQNLPLTTSTETQLQ